jgi:hypothetical protein
MFAEIHEVRRRHLCTGSWHTKKKEVIEITSHEPWSSVIVDGRG